MWIARSIEKELRSISRTRPALLLTGARQSGKTSLLRKVFPSCEYVALDLPRVAEEAEEEGESFLARHGTPLILDEIQHAPGLFPHLKRAIDDRREATGLYLLAGSQKFPLMEGISESLAGRLAIVELHSLSLLELERWSGRTCEGELLLEWMFRGGYPELHARELDPARFYGDYLTTYLERDVRQVVQVRSLRDFDRFMRLLALRTGQLLSMTSLASDVGVSPNTIRSWISVLEASNVIVLLEPYYRNLGKRIVKTPKMYFLDTGLACFLAGIRSAGDLRASGLLGSMFETLVLGQMIRRHANRGLRPNVYFYRDHHGHEVDFVVPVGERLRLFECKWSEQPSSSVKGFAEIERLAGEDTILSKTIIGTARGRRRRRSADVIVDDAVELASLEGED